MPVPTAGAKPGAQALRMPAWSQTGSRTSPFTDTKLSNSKRDASALKKGFRKERRTLDMALKRAGAAAAAAAAAAPWRAVRAGSGARDGDSKRRERGEGGSDAHARPRDKHRDTRRHTWTGTWRRRRSHSLIRRATPPSSTTTRRKSAYKLPYSLVVAPPNPHPA